MSADAVENGMLCAVEEARRSRFRVEPNPLVGAAALSRDGGHLQDAAHERYGGLHAEAELIRRRRHAGEYDSGTLLVTLEPCAHMSKKTPPCVPRIIEAGFTRVVAGAPDPNPATAGLAAKAFAAAGVAYDVLPETSPAGQACRTLVRRYVRHLTAQRPWTIAKWAMSLDGRIADAAGASRWISGEKSRAFVDELRGSVEAVVVGVGTVLADDPSLVSRSAGGGRALRVVFDSKLRTPPTAKLVATARPISTLVVAARGADAARRLALEAAGAQVVEVAPGADGRVDVAEAFGELHRRGVRRALLEAGGTLLAACCRAGVVDQVATFVAPKIIGGDGPTPFSGAGWMIGDAPRLEEDRLMVSDDDALIEGYWPRS